MTKPNGPRQAPTGQYTASKAAPRFASTPCPPVPPPNRQRRCAAASAGDGPQQLNKTRNRVGYWAWQGLFSLAWLLGPRRGAQVFVAPTAVDDAGTGVR